MRRQSVHVMVVVQVIARLLAPAPVLARQLQADARGALPLAVARALGPRLQADARNAVRRAAAVALLNV